MSSSTTPNSLNVVCSVKDLLATVRHRIASTKSVMDPPSEGEVEALLKVFHQKPARNGLYADGL